MVRNEISDDELIARYIYSNAAGAELDRERLARLLEQLDEFRRLPDDWDSYGADAISDCAIDISRDLIAQIVLRHIPAAMPVDPSIDVMPLASGGVQIELTSGARYLEVEISPDGDLSLLDVGRENGDRIATTCSSISVDELLSAIHSGLRRA